MNGATSFDPVDRWIAARPLALCTGCFLTGVIAARLAGLSPIVWGAGAAAALILFAALRKKALLFFAVMLLGAVWMALFLLKPAVSARDDVIMTGTVDAAPVVTDRYVRLRMTDCLADGEAVGCRVMLYLYDAEDPPVFGDRLTLAVNMYLPGHAGNEGSFDYADWLWRQRVALCASSSEKKIADRAPQEGFSLTGLALRVREGINAHVRGVFPEDAAGIAQALLTGDRSGMDEETKDAFRASGVSHLLALSGLHVGLLLTALNWLLRKMRLSRGAALAVTVPFMAGYALIVGMTPSVLRACLMYAAGQAAVLDGRGRDGLSVMCLTLLVLLIVNPLYIEDAGFVLSYAAVTALILLPVPAGLRAGSADSVPVRGLKYAGSAVWVSLAAQIGALPATVMYYNQIPVWFLPFNIVLGPVMALLLPLLIAACILSAVMPFGAAYFTAFPALIIRVFRTVTAWGADMPLALLNTADWPAALIALYAAAVFLMSPYTRAGQRRIPRACAAAAIPLIVALGLVHPWTAERDDCLKITFLDVGQGDGAILSCGGQVYLVDVGDGTTMAEYLLNRGISPDGIFLSHAHADHAGGLDAIMDAFAPCSLYVSREWTNSPMDEKVDAAWQRVIAEGWPVTYLTQGDEMNVSRLLTFRVWLPGDHAPADQNAASMVLSAHYGQACALFAGDLTMSREFAYFPDCDILKVAHHGANKSTGEIMLAQTTPTAAVISVGHNSFGHPGAETLDRLSGAVILRTDRLGRITARLHQDGSMTVDTYYREGER